MGQKTLLDALESICHVDVDSVDPRIATALPFKPHNHNINNITGRVLVQVSLSRVMSKERVLEQCYSFDRAFVSHGISSRDQYAIKISTTGPAMATAAVLQKQGFRVLGTSLFSLAQAIAASQAECLFISPYLNGVAAYSDDSLLHRSSDLALNSSASMVLSCEPKPKPETPYYKDLNAPDRFAHFNKIDPLAGADWDGKLADIHTDYISNDGKALVEAMQSDPAVVRKIKDVFGASLDGERRAQVALQAEIDKFC
ncbi:hypothetical protein N7493_006445 [Penicillium malachiteum]|uniref:Transaldolase n=1 Tax=Penicillium malachiteum TaxID=1324776 RepID=A0AAD6HKK2_9EURO|nr:hypothetical protein N7493_006445 [Penicillium malachiteum]